ncbi:hypothetical protein [Belnapia rosea]|uniref:hypothetical protein n=1 Tax=Belnapia rosea TaxID=938405 RepID=UPI00115FB6A0|nr:hypothetical protein [Belnapia rosea]
MLLKQRERNVKQVDLEQLHRKNRRDLLVGGGLLVVGSIFLLTLLSTSLYFAADGNRCAFPTALCNSYRSAFAGMYYAGGQSEAGIFGMLVDSLPDVSRLPFFAFFLNIVGVPAIIAAVIGAFMLAQRGESVRHLAQAEKQAREEMAKDAYRKRMEQSGSGTGRR